MLTKFLQLFNPLPGNQYLHVSQKKNEISRALEVLLEDVGGKLNIELYNQENLSFSQPFRALPRDHDIVILQDVFSLHVNPSMLLKISYRTLANTAEIIILEKKGVLDIEKVKETLEAHEFRTPNFIDILDGYDIIVAKKMHMWGNGL